MAAKQINVNSALLPEVYAPFVPQELDVQLAFPELNLAAVGEELMKVDLSDEKKSSAESDKAFEKLLSGGDMVMAFPKISAKSSVYDAEISGEVRGTPMSKSDYSLKASILARDFDKTITAIQDLAKSNPELNQVSFGLMMVKGFGKTDPDGRQRWDVSVARDGSVTVNDQVIKGAD
jgi:hypothetical protein